MKTQINLFASFALNYPYNFIKLAFASLPDHLINHLQNKFDTAYDKRGTFGAMIDFYSQLDNENRILLENYITNNYKNN